MAKPHKTLSKTESAIQLGNILKGGAGGGTRKGLIAKAKKLLKIGEKTTKSTSPIKEVKKAKKSLKNQKVNKGAKKLVATKGLSKKSLAIRNKYKGYK